MEDSYDNGYAQGFATGLRWKDNYQPGGPWVCKPRPTDRNKPENMERCLKSQKNYNGWHEGFDTALILRGIDKKEMFV